MIGKKPAGVKTLSGKGTKRRFLRRKALFCGLAVLLAAGGALGLYIKAKSSSGEKEAAIMSARAEKGDVSTTISSSGTLCGEEIAVVNLPAGIKIKKVLVSEGDIVKKGTKLASVYKASAAEILLSVRESIDDTEDDLDNLDDDEIADTTSDDYLQKLSLDQQLEDLESLESRLEKIIESGYVTADQNGVIGTIGVADDTEVGADVSEQTTDSSGNTSGNTKNTSSSKAVSVTGSTTSTTAAAAPYRLASSSVCSMAVLKADGTDTDSETVTSKSSADDDAAESEAEEEAAEEEQSTEETRSTDSDEGEKAEQNNDRDQDISGSQDNDKGSSDSGTSSTNSSTTTSGKGQSNQTNENRSDNQTSNNNQNSGKVNGASGGKAGGAGGGAASTAGSSGSTSSDDSSVGDIEMAAAFRLNSNDRMLVTVSVDEADIESAEAGQSAEITLNALPDETLTGVITKIGNVASSSSGSAKYSVEIAVDKTDQMKEGMTASATIYIEEAKEALLIPSAAIQEENGKAYVYTKKESDDNLSGKTEVTTGLSDGSKVQVTEGLQEGDTVYYAVISRDSGDNGDRRQDKGPGDMGGGMPGGAPPSGGPDGNHGQ